MVANGSTSTIPHLSAKEYCNYPAKSEEKILLKQALLPNELNDPICEKLAEYLTIHQSDTVSIVFSAYNLHAPASMFGHTLLKFSKGTASTDLLDMAINYGAKVTTSNPIMYAWKGLWGGFKGEFSSLPYYYKIREYNDFESRDLWTYDLDLTNYQKQILLFYLWEYGQKDLDYYYFDENCSYLLLKLLDMTLPHKNILKDFFTTYVIPIDTVKILDKVGLIKHTSLRPSLRYKSIKIFEQLTEFEKSTVLDFIKKDDVDEKSIQSMNKESAANILEGLISAYDYLYAQDILLEKGERYQQKKKILELRSKIDSLGKNFDISGDIKQSPVLGHSTHRFGFGQMMGRFRNGNTRNETILTARAAIHDELDPPNGWPREMSVDMLSMQLAYNWNTDNFPFHLKNLDVLKIETKNPVNALRWEKTIKMRLGISTQMNKYYDEYVVPDLVVGGGVSIPLNNPQNTSNNILWTNTIDTQLNYGKKFDRYPFRLGMGLHSSLRYWYSDQWVNLIKFESWRYLYKEKGNSFLSIESRFHTSSSFSIGITGMKSFSRSPLKDSVSLLLYYFL